jgi:asparagine synthase (glutamine-hydrolysing)
MCGIAGILGLPDKTAVERMMAAMVRRGPDDSGYYEDPRIALGHRRLSVIDLSQAGHQPMSRAEGRLWIVYNGEVYNFAALRRDLEGRGHHFVSRSDTEVILALYEEKGVECFAHLKGMFALAIWDLRGPCPLLVMARDHFGIKPLLYSTIPEGIVFASDMAGIIASGRVALSIDRVALLQYLMHGHVVQPRTILAGVQMVPAAHVLTVRPGEEPRLRRYWSLDYDRCASLGRGLDPQEQASHVRMLLEQAARSQMVSDVPLGAFLSGGVDSSAVVALMSRASGSAIHTYSVGFPEERLEFDESEDAERSARYLGAVHQAVRVSGRQAAEVLPAIAADLGQPSVDGMNMHFVSRAARTGVTVALAGIGGDELFAGYGSFANLSRHASLPVRLRRAAMKARWSSVRWLGRSTEMKDRWESLWARQSFAAAYMSHHMVRSPEEAWRLAGRPELEAAAVFAYAAMDEPRIPDPVSRVSLLESSLYMQSQLLRDADAASMAHSLEVRVPLLDVDLAEFVFGLPGAAKLGGSTDGTGIVGKKVLLQAVKDLIPEWTWRKPKRGFMMPFGEWLRGPLRPLVEDVLSDSGFRSRGWIDPSEANREWQMLLRDSTVNWSRVWTIMMLGLWERNLLRRVESLQGT